MPTNDNVKKDNFYLSKSLFIRGVQCHKSLYLQKYRPELKEEVSDEKERLFDVGHEVGELAQNLFPGGALVPYDGLSHEEQIKMTSSLIAKGCKTIYEATFVFNGIFIKADILHRGNDGWEVYEVKASTEVKDYHLNDVSVQYYVISQAGLQVSKVLIVHINTAYVRQGEIEVNKLFIKTDISGIAKEKEPFIIEELQKQRNMLKGDEPLIDIGPHCDSPFECDFKGYCWKHIPAPSVFDYRDKGRPNSFVLYKQGIVRMEDVPPDILGWRQKMQHDGTLYQKSQINTDAVRTFLKSLWYPLCFMDFETIFMAPIPLFDKTRPYQQVAFQYSLHVANELDGKLEHYEFLADGTTNPQREFIERLLVDIPQDSCILVWNKSFEVTRLKELAVSFPGKDMAISAVIKNIRDMMSPFQNKSIYHWQFDGSYSIKAVLPALVPDLSYDSLDISDGGMASNAWIRMIKSTNETEKLTIRKHLLQYCNQDTYAMVRILEEMKKIANNA